MSHQLENSETVLAGTHPADKCKGEFCTIHNMSNHGLRELEQRWNGEFMERVSPEGAVWPDPDDPLHPQRPNAAICLDCGVLLYSRFRHDYKECECGNLMVDGGSAYVRRGWKDQSRIVEVNTWPIPAGWR
jgi:hypothetical protein